MAGESKRLRLTKERKEVLEMTELTMRGTKCNVFEVVCCYLMISLTRNAQWLVLIHISYDYTLLSIVS